MARTFEVDRKAAKEANNGGKRITEPGIYSGKFRAAWYEKAEKGTEGVAFFFQNESGQEAGPLVIYTHKANGDELPGYKLVNAIAVCMGGKKIEPRRAKVTFFDYDTKQDVLKEKDVYPALVGKIGLFLQLEEYTKNNGEQGTRLVINAPFNPDTRLMAVEIVDGITTPKRIDAYATYFETVKVKKEKGRKESSQSQSSPPADDFEDDIPF